MNRFRYPASQVEWQDEYFAVSVSESMIDKVRDYIKNQEEHHLKKSFQEEYDEFISKYGLEKFKE
ncbi:transposase [Aquiflexum sp. TKW24L]|nr:transposase [Aquiflexum sp. TKW24L]MCL6260244.1 transposase [Aquiflexum sp. TKW24L]